jgi:hypothetical protein
VKPLLFWREYEVRVCVMKKEEEPGSTKRGSLYTPGLNHTPSHTVLFAHHKSMTQVTADFEDATARHSRPYPSHVALASLF